MATSPWKRTMASSTAGSLDRPWSVGRCKVMDEHLLRRVVLPIDPRIQKSGIRMIRRHYHQTTMIRSSDDGGKDIPRSNLDISSHLKFGHSSFHGRHLIDCGCNDSLMNASGGAYFRSEISTRQFHSWTKSEQLLKRGTKYNRTTCFHVQVDYQLKSIYLYYSLAKSVSVYPPTLYTSQGYLNMAIFCLK